MTPGLVLMNSLLEGYRLFLPELDPLQNATHRH